MDVFAIVRVRGIRSMKPRIKETLELLRLHRPNHCVVLPATPSILGMLNVAKDYVAYGKVGEETLFKLLSKRGEKGSSFLRTVKKESEIKSIAKELASGKRSEEVDLVFRLHPPRKGYKDIKSQYPVGDLGKRDDMETFLVRMM